MKFENENFPSVFEFKGAVKECVYGRCAGEWPENDWFDVGSQGSVKVWRDLDQKRITVYPDLIGDRGMRTTDPLGGIVIE